MWQTHRMCHHVSWQQYPSSVLNTKFFLVKNVNNCRMQIFGESLFGWESFTFLSPLDIPLIPLNLTKKHYQINKRKNRKKNNKINQLKSSCFASKSVRHQRSTSCSLIWHHGNSVKFQIFVKKTRNNHQIPFWNRRIQIPDKSNVIFNRRNLKPEIKKYQKQCKTKAELNNLINDRGNRENREN